MRVYGYDKNAFAKNRFSKIGFSAVSSQAPTADRLPLLFRGIRRASTSISSSHPCQTRAPSTGPRCKPHLNIVVLLESVNQLDRASGTSPSHRINQLPPYTCVKLHPPQRSTFRLDLHLFLQGTNLAGYLGTGTFYHISAVQKWGGRHSPPCQTADGKHSNSTDENFD
jgi:hypothetical protein